VPAIVSEALWDRANTLYKARSAQMRSRQSAAAFHNRYAYSGKLVCEEHETGFHRRVLKSAGGGKEVWQCRVYRQRGRAACAAPQLRTTELDEIMAKIFTALIQDPKAIADALAAVIQNVSAARGCERDAAKLEAEMARIQAKKERLLALGVAGALSVPECKSRSDGCNKQLAAAKQKLDALRAGRTASAAAEHPASIKEALRRELTFADGIHSELVASILDHIVVKKDSTKEEIHLEIHLKCGHPRDVRFRREKSSLRLLCF
ncbi:MAG: recombinase zinc beta ribbon domain-containing protein, partial [Oscillospiraceae bacterium]|jgi:hypothetical protein|nr:recombinase zinc beta ribbon domain-containing protein [Oscillospiraceae bacterium]